MKQQPIADFECCLLDILVRAMSRITSLKSNNFFPSVGAELRACLARLARVLQEGAPRNVLEQRHASSQAPRSHPHDVPNPWMRLITGSKYSLSLTPAVDLINLCQLEKPKSIAVLAGESE